MSHETYKKYLSPEYPKRNFSESSQGVQYRYLIPRAEHPGLQEKEGLPKVGDLWDRTYDYGVVSVEYTPKIGGSGFDLLEVSTIRNLPSTNSKIGINVKATEKESRYQLRWLPQSLPLQKHPNFQPPTLTGGDLATFRKHILGWERELDPEKQANYQYSPRDSNGDVLGAVVTIPSGSAAYKYVTLRLLGHENYVVFAPTWSKVGIYEGTEPPPFTNIGQKETLSGKPTPPTGWEWVKTDDSSERQGAAPRWTRTETWTGAKKVDYDLDEIFAV